MAYDLGVLGSASDEGFLFPVFCCGVSANHYKSDTALNGDMSVDSVHFLKLLYFFLTTHLKLRSEPHNCFQRNGEFSRESATRYSFCVVACENIPQKKYCSDVRISCTWKGPHGMSWAQEYNMPIKMQNTSCNYSTLPPSSMHNWGVSAEVPFWCVAAIGD